jgi:hypothetical protein
MYVTNTALYFEATAKVLRKRVMEDIIFKEELSDLSSSPNNVEAVKSRKI